MQTVKRQKEISVFVLLILLFFFRIFWQSLPNAWGRCDEFRLALEVKGYPTYPVCIEPAPVHQEEAVGIDDTVFGKVSVLQEKALSTDPSDVVILFDFPGKVISIP